MEIKVCKKCGRAHNAEENFCPSCGRSSEPYTWDPESYANVGCLLAFILVILILILAPLILTLSVLFR